MSLVGCVDFLSDRCIAGWAADTADLAAAVRVDIIVNSNLVATICCADFRGDLAAAGFGDGRKAFSFDPSGHLRPGRNQLEVFFAGTATALPNGRAGWVNSREGELSEAESDFLAALELYHEFLPEDHIGVLGESATYFERLFRAASIPFQDFQPVERDRPLAGRLDILILPPAADEAVPAAWSLQQVVQDHLNPSGIVAACLGESEAASGQARRALEDCGVSNIAFESIVPVPGIPYPVCAFAQAGVRVGQSLPVLAHIHVPKCAGTAFRVFLERHLGPAHLSLYIDDTYFVYGNEALRGYLRRPGLRAFSSHHVRRFPRWLAGREILYVTFLRDPVQQFVSYMTHIKKHYASITSPSLLEAVPPDAPQLPLRDFARWLLTHSRDIPFRANHNVQFFSKHSAPGAAASLEAAQEALQRFFLVGVAERMEESMEKLRLRAGPVGLEFPSGPVTIENTSAEYRDDLHWITPDDEVGSLLLRSVEQDRRLYQWAAARL